MRRWLRRFPKLHFWLARVKYAFAPVNLPKVGKGTWIHPTAMFTGPMDGVVIGDNVRIEAYAQISNSAGSRIVIGDNTTLAPFSLVQSSLRNCLIEIGKHCSLQRYSIIYGAGPVKIGDYCRIASHSTIVPVNKRFDDPNAPIHHQGGSYEGITLEGDVWVGSGVRILDGVTIGKGSILAAGAVVNRSFPPMSIVAGVPARLVRARETSDAAHADSDAAESRAAG